MGAGTLELRGAALLRAAADVGVADGVSSPGIAHEASSVNRARYSSRSPESASWAAGQHVADRELVGEDIGLSHGGSYQGRRLSFALPQLRGAQLDVEAHGAPHHEEPHPLVLEPRGEAHLGDAVGATGFTRARPRAGRAAPPRRGGCPSRSRVGGAARRRGRGRTPRGARRRSRTGARRRIRAPRPSRPWIFFTRGFALPDIYVHIAWIPSVATPRTHWR